MKYKRLLLKLSGQSLANDNSMGISYAKVKQYSQEVKKIVDIGVQVGIVVGGGNIIRGAEGRHRGIINRVQGDHMGMLATMINAMSIQSALESLGVFTRLMSGLRMDQVCEPYIQRKAVRHLEKGRIIIFGAGIGSPFFTTDSAASLRAVEIDADVILKGTRIDGVYDRDPEKNAHAKKYENLSYDKAYEKKLKIMDMTAFTLCKEHHLPIVVFDMNKEGNLLKIVKGEKVGTTIWS